MPIQEIEVNLVYAYAYSRLSLNGHLYKTDTSVKRTPCLHTENHVKMPETYKDPLFSYYNLWKVQNKKGKTKKIHTNDNN